MVYLGSLTRWILSSILSWRTILVALYQIKVTLSFHGASSEAIICDRARLVVSEILIRSSILMPFCQTRRSQITAYILTCVYTHNMLFNERSVTMYEWSHTLTLTRTPTRVCARAHTHTHTHTYIYIYIHSYTHIQADTERPTDQ